MPSIGIDLGTTHAYVAVSQNGKVTVIENDQGRRVLSCVAFSSSERLIGEPAIHQMARNPKNTLYDVKRILGRNFNDPEVKKWMKYHPSKLEQNGPEGKLKMMVEYAGSNEEFCPEEITAMLLVNLKQIAESYLGDHQVTGAVITVPTSFNNLQRQATLDAAAIAGIRVIGLINETTAAALNCSLRNETTKKRNVLIYHIGGGTYHAAVVVLEENTVKVLAADGRSNFGGDYFTKDLFKKAVTKFEKENSGCKVSNSSRAACRIRSACEKAKCELSHSTSTSFKIDAVMNGKDLHMEISREMLHDLAVENVKTIMESVDKAMKRSGLKQSEIDDVYLVGGGTRMIVFQDKFGERFPTKIRKTLNVDEAAVLGAAEYAEMISDSLPSRRTAHLEENPEIRSYAIEDISFFPIEVDNGNEVKIIKPRPYNQRLVLSTNARQALKVYEVDDNRKYLIGEFEIDNSCASSVDIDSDGLVRVIRKHTKPSFANVGRGIKNDELKKLAKHAEKFEEEEENRKKSVQALHLYERFVFEERRKLTKDAWSGKRKHEIESICSDEFIWIQSPPSNVTEGGVKDRKEKFLRRCREITSDPKKTPTTAQDEKNAEVEGLIKMTRELNISEETKITEPTTTVTSIVTKDQPQKRQLPTGISRENEDEKNLPTDANSLAKSMREQAIAEERAVTLTDRNQNLPSVKNEEPKEQLLTKLSSADEEKKNLPAEKSSLTKTEGLELHEKALEVKDNTNVQDDVDATLANKSLQSVNEETRQSPTGVSPEDGEESYMPEDVTSPPTTEEQEIYGKKNENAEEEERTEDARSNSPTVRQTEENVEDCQSLGEVRVQTAQLDELAENNQITRKMKDCQNTGTIYSAQQIQEIEMATGSQALLPVQNQQSRDEEWVMVDRDIKEKVQDAPGQQPVSRQSSTPFVATNQPLEEQQESLEKHKKSATSKSMDTNNEVAKAKKDETAKFKSPTDARNKGDAVTAVVFVQNSSPKPEEEPGCVTTKTGQKSKEKKSGNVATNPSKNLPNIINPSPPKSPKPSPQKNKSVAAQSAASRQQISSTHEHAAPGKGRKKEGKAPATGRGATSPPSGGQAKAGNTNKKTKNPPKSNEQPTKVASTGKAGGKSKNTTTKSGDQSNSKSKGNKNNPTAKQKKTSQQTNNNDEKSKSHPRKK